MLFFSLLCPQEVNSTNFGKSPINNQSRRQGASYLTTLVNLVHSERYRHYLAPRLRSGAALHCQGSAWGIRDMQHVCNLPAWKRWRSSWHYALSDDCVTMTYGPKNRINDTECLEGSEDSFQNCKWFSNFSVLCECWWKLLVHCKTLIYFGQLCGQLPKFPFNIHLLLVLTSAHRQMWDSRSAHRR
jgi:hypothetical protein